MARRYFNWKLVIVLLMALAVLGGTAFVLRQWQRSRRAELGLVRGTKAYDEQNWEQAAQQFGRYLNVMQDNVPVLHKYAEAQMNIRPLKQNNIQQAIAAYRNILRLDQNNFEATKRLSEIYLRMGMPGEAELIAARTLQTDKSPEMREIFAIALAGQRKFTEAEKELKSIIKINPERVSTYEVLGRLAEQRPDDFPETADFWFDRMVNINQSSAEAHIARGAYLLRHSNKDKALADLEQAEQMDLSDTAVRLRLAEELVNAGALDRAGKQLEIVHASEPGNRYLWRQWAKLALKSNSNDTMFKVADNGLKELSAQSWDFMPDAVELFIRCGQLERAEECLDALRQKDIAPATTAFLEGLLAEKQGDVRKAAECWHRAVQMGNKSARVRLALANSLWRLGDRQACINQLRTLVSEQPGLFSGRMALVQMLTQTGQWAEAAEQTRAAKQIDPKNIEVNLLDVGVRLQLLADSGTDENSVLYRDIKATLDDLDNTTGGNLEVDFLRVHLAILQKNLPDAEKLIADLKKIHPSEIKVLLAQADLLVAQNRTDDAVAVLREALGSFPQSTAVLKYLVTLLAEKDQRQDCVALLENALKSTETPFVKRELGLMLSDLYNRWNEDGKRYSILKSLAEQMPDDVIIWRELLTCKEVLGNVGFAQQIVDKIKNIEGDDGWQWRYEQAKIWFAEEDFKARYPQIVSLLQGNLLANPDDQASRMLLASTYEKGDNQRLAISTYTEALNRSPSDVRIMVPTVAALYRGGEYDRAEEILKRAAKEKLYHPELERLEVRGALRRGDLSSANDTLENMLRRDPNSRSLLLSLALLKIRQDKLIEAEKMVEQLRAEEPNSLPIAAVQVDLGIRKGDSEGVLRLCDEMVEKLNTASAFLLRGRTYVVLGRVALAKDDFERAVSLEPNNPDTWITKSAFHRSLGELDEAIADIRHALSVMPEDLRIQKSAVALYLDSGVRDLQQQGEAILEKALISNPDDTELLLRKARMLLAKGMAPQIKQASGILQAITEKQPEVTGAWALLAQIALQEGKPAGAIDVALRGLVHSPNDKSLLLLKARAEAVRSPELALPTMKALWELEPNNVDTVVSLAEAYMAADRYDDAVVLLNKQPIPAGSSQQRKIKLAIASALYKSGSKTKSEQIFKELSDSEPNDRRPLLAQIRLLLHDNLWDRLRDKTDTWCEEHPGEVETTILIVNELAGVKDNEGGRIAEDLLRCILKQNESSAVIMLRLGILLQNTGRSAEAATFYQRVLELQPDNLVAINNLAWILCEEQGRPGEALELAQQGLAKAPDYVDLIDTRGMAYYRLGRYGEAIQDFNRCLRLYPGREPKIVSSYFHLGMCLAGLGEKNKAIEQLNKALELNNELNALGDVEIREAHRLMEKLSEGES
ncbi:MAG: tetratricopeptide repeat protein [Planctomycetota bacterium]